MSTVNRSSGTGRSRDAAGTTGTGTRRHHQAAFQLPEVPLLIEVRDDAEETLIMG